MEIKFGDIINIGFPNPNQTQDLRVIVGDVGGTKTLLSYYQVSSGKFELIDQARYRSKNYETLIDILDDYLKDKETPDRLSLGVAGPIVQGKVYLTNLGWNLDTQEIHDRMNIDRVYFLNDLVANAYGLGGLTENDIMTIHHGDPSLQGNAVIISPGTGLGEAGMYFNNDKYYPFATEGGHTDYAPENEEDLQIFKCLQKKYGHVSWERVVSGMGILEVHACLNSLTTDEAQAMIIEKYGVDDPAAAISHGARSGNEKCAQTMHLFLRNLANESANLVMKLMGTGGVFIGGGIVPKNLDMLQAKEFVGYFLEAGRMGPVLEKVPIHIILNDQTALIGAALYGYYNN